MLRQQLARATTQRSAHNVAINTTTARRAFSASVRRKAEVEITIDGQKVMIEQVSNCRACLDGRGGGGPHVRHEVREAGYEEGGVYVKERRRGGGVDTG